jgi:LCP family protein required for cell wall assembly
VNVPRFRHRPRVSASQLLLGSRRSQHIVSQLPVTSIVLVMLGFVISGTLGAFAFFLPAFATALGATGHKSDIPILATVAAATATATPQPGAPFTVLLLGSDDDQKFDPNHVLTQSMILVRVEPAAKKVTMLSIPRDLWVPLSTGGSAKIDAAYAYGGARPAIATVERDFHVHIDDYVWIGLKGLVRLIDLFGGVDVVTSNPVLDDFYPNDVDSRYPYGFQRVAVLPGPQHLGGKQALEYVRSRHSDLRGDFGRSFRQQQVLVALRAKARYLSPADLPDLATVLSGEFKTSMGLDRIRQLLPVAAQVQPSQVTQIVLLGGYTTSQQIDGQYALVPVWSRILPLVHQYFP